MGGFDFRAAAPSFADFTLTFGVSATVEEEEKNNILRFTSYLSSRVMAAGVKQQRVPFFTGAALTFSFTRETFL